MWDEGRSVGGMWGTNSLACKDFLILTGGMCDSFKIEVGCKTDNHRLQTLCVNIPSGGGGGMVGFSQK